MQLAKLPRAARHLATIVALCGLVVITQLGGPQSAQADSEVDWSNTQTAEILLVLRGFHEFVSHNGDANAAAEHLADMAGIWAQDTTFVVNGSTTFTGRDAILTFFANSPFFNNNWISLSPTFRTEVEIHGNTAEIYLECIFVNQADTVAAKRALSGTLKKVRGKWLFWDMETNPSSPLF
ncbi:MAG: hypothetical protein ACKV19_15860 [Verrucomicrobiales bacterium]